MSEKRILLVSVACILLGGFFAGCGPYPHVSDRFGLPERLLFNKQARRPVIPAVDPITGEDAQRIMARYRGATQGQDQSSGGKAGGSDVMVLQTGQSQSSKPSGFVIRSN